MPYTTCFTLFFTLHVSIQAEYFTAQSELEYLVETHMRVIEDLESYIDKEEERVSNLKRYLNIFKREHKKTIQNIPKYLGNPINAFTLIKRLTLDLKDIKRNIELAKEHMNSATMNHVNLKYPSLVDLNGAASALARLQKTYNLDIHDLSEGILNGVTSTTPMTASDCYEISHALMLKYADMARGWMVEALRKYNEEKNAYPFNDADIMDYLSVAYYLSGDLKNGLKWAQKVIELNDDHPPAKDNLRYDNIVDKSKLFIREEETDLNDDEPLPSNEEMMMRVYEHLCRDGIGISSKVSKRLTCRYLTENDPFLKIAPIKMEMLHVDPDVILFHDVLSDHEIETLKQKSRPRLQEAQIYIDNTGNSLTDYRIAKLSWLFDKESDVIARVSRQVMYMTGLSIETAEPLHVVNYGIGGHYEPHYDNVMKKVIGTNSGNRIATVIFYLSDVAQGGATVFPWLGLSVYPVKGAAVYWQNLHASGDTNLMMLHASCPVLEGSKWVANKWLHLKGQERLKPCNLKYKDDNIPESISDHIFKAVFENSGGK